MLSCPDAVFEVEVKKLNNNCRRVLSIPDRAQWEACYHGVPKHIDNNCFTKESGYFINIIYAMSQGQIVDDYTIL